MSVEQIVQLDWKGEPSISAVRDAINRRQNVELSLPANYHHALYALMYPRAEAGQAETLDVTGGAELLAEIAEVEGLIDFAGLVQPAASAKARITLISPSPKIVIRIPAASA